MLQPPQFYRFMKDGGIFAMPTDTAMREGCLAGIADADGYLIESNHDVGILRAGSYKLCLKQRDLVRPSHL